MAATFQPGIRVIRAPAPGPEGRPAVPGMIRRLGLGEETRLGDHEDDIEHGIALRGANASGEIAMTPDGEATLRQWHPGSDASTRTLAVGTRFTFGEYELELISLGPVDDQNRRCRGCGSILDYRTAFGIELNRLPCANCRAITNTDGRFMSGAKVMRLEEQLRAAEAEGTLRALLIGWEYFVGNFEIPFVQDYQRRFWLRGAESAPVRLLHNVVIFHGYLVKAFNQEPAYEKDHQLLVTGFRGARLVLQNVECSMSLVEPVL